MQAAEGDTEEALDPPRGALRLMGDRTVGAFFVGRFASVVGAWMHNIAAALFMYRLTDSATMVAAVTVAQFLPALLLMPWCGALADRADRRWQVMGGGVVAGVGSAGLAVWIVLAPSPDDVPAVAVLLAAVFVGAGFALEVPSLQALIPSLVRPGELPAAVALNSAPITVAQAAGPVIGALLVSTSGPAWAFTVAAIGQFAFVVLLAGLPLSGRPSDRRPGGSLWDGLRWVRAHPPLRTLILVVAAVAVGGDPIITLTPSLAESLGGGPVLVGQLASAFGIGASLGFLVLTPARRLLGPARLVPTGLVVIAVGLAGTAVMPSAVAALLLLGLSGVGTTWAVTTATALVLQESPEALRGRLMALWAMALLGTRPFSAAVSGATADRAGVTSALLLVAAVVLIAAWPARPSRMRPGLCRG